MIKTMIKKKKTRRRKKLILKLFGHGTIFNKSSTILAMAFYDQHHYEQFSYTHVTV